MNKEVQQVRYWCYHTSIDTLMVSPNDEVTLFECYFYGLNSSYPIERAKWGKRHIDLRNKEEFQKVFPWATGLTQWPDIWKEAVKLGLTS